jgi:asparagine synthase (glutamine-hydrolysing)
MCRIAGFWDRKSSPVSILGQTIIAMRDSMTYGGPDDAGFYLDPANGLALGHRRLSILDLSPLGHQPMFSSSGRFGLVYNGEVYNYRAIARELETRGRTFRGTSDTEVILEAFETWGLADSLPRLIGMFALAVWDREDQTLTLVRDRLGIKPLYYGWVDGAFVFASELKAFRAHPRCRPSIDREVLALFFRHNYVPAPYSIYKNIRKVQPGQVITVTRALLQEERVSLSNFWSAAEAVRRGLDHPFPGDFEEARDELETLLNEAVRLRLISDVPLGAFLSGGIDSSLVVALMQRQAGNNVRTFSIGFDQPTYNEAPFARAVARHLGTEHTELVVTDQEARDVIPLLPDLYDEPFADSSQIPTYILSRLTRQQVTVSLSGDGGDELFCGYDRYTWGQIIWQRLGWMPAGLRTAGQHLLLSLAPAGWDALLSRLSRFLPSAWAGAHPGDRVHKLAEALGFGNPSELYHRLVSHWCEPRSLVRGVDGEPPTAFTTPQGSPPGLDFIRQMQFLDLTNYLPDDILTKVDRASMAVALEARVPLLDHRVVELAWRLPPDFKYRNGHGKWILRKILDRYIPPKLFERPKMGFGIPIDSWLRGPLRNWAADLLSADRLKREGFLNSESVGLKWQEHLSGKRNWQYLLWDVLVWEAWLERWG